MSKAQKKEVLIDINKQVGKMEEVYNILSVAKANGETFTQEQADALARDIVNTSGSLSGSPEASVSVISQKLIDYYKKL